MEGTKTSSWPYCLKGLADKALGALDRTQCLLGMAHLGLRLGAKVRIPVWVSLAVMLLRDSRLSAGPGPSATIVLPSSRETSPHPGQPRSFCDESLPLLWLHWPRLVNGASPRAVTCDWRQQTLGVLRSDCICCWGPALLVQSSRRHREAVETRKVGVHFHF